MSEKSVFQGRRHSPEVENCLVSLDSARMAWLEWKEQWRVEVQVAGKDGDGPK